MNRDMIKGDWKRMKGNAREKWGKLAGDDLDRVKGKFEQLVGTLQKRYGWEREQAERAVEEFEHKHPDEDGDARRPEGPGADQPPAAM